MKSLALVVILMSPIFSCTAQPADEPVRLAPSVLERASEPFPTPDGRRIVFTGGAFPETDLYLADADGSDVVQLTNEPGPDHYGSLSPDGQRLVFSSRRDGTWKVWVMNADGSDPFPLAETSTRESDPSRPVWSPDGTRIAFAVRAESDTYDLYVMEADGTNVRLVVAGGREPAWSPDGTRIAYSADGPTPTIVIAALDGTNQAAVTDGSAVALTPSWSSDGTRIAYLSGAHGPPNWEVYTVGVDGSDPVRVTENDDWDFYPLFLPVADQILFVSIRDGHTSPGLYVVRADGSDPRRILP